jgi:hypothetical protein
METGLNLVMLEPMAHTKLWNSRMLWPLDVLMEIIDILKLGNDMELCYAA